MARFGFCSATYTSRSNASDAERAINLYPEIVEGQGQSSVILVGTPGLKLFCDSSEASVRNGVEFNGRSYFIAGKKLYELKSNGTKTLIGAVADDGTRPSFAFNSASPTQMLVASGGSLYLVLIPVNTMTTITDPGNVRMVEFIDGYFIALLNNTSIVRLSGIEDGVTWDALDQEQVSYFPDNVVSMLADHRELWMFGDKKTVVYADSGDANTQVVPIPSAFLEQGCGAKFSPCRIDNSVFWIGKDERGQAMAWRAQGYSPARISTHAVEYQWQQYSTVADAIGYAFQDSGHAFWHIYFPTANKSWRFDTSTGLWHEVASGSQNNAAHLSQCHWFAFGKHLVGDWNSGKIYEMSSAYYDDDGAPLVSLRRCPVIGTEMEWMKFDRLTVHVEAGVGTATGQGIDPTLMMRFSDDWGQNWSNERTVSIGGVGAYQNRAIFRRLGMARYRVFEISISDPVKRIFIDAYIDSPNYGGPMERIGVQARKSA